MSKAETDGSAIGNRTSEIDNPKLRYFGDYELFEEIARGAGGGQHSDAGGRQ